MVIDFRALNKITVKDRFSLPHTIAGSSATRRPTNTRRPQPKVEGPDSEVPDECRWQTSLSHMTRVATEARSRTAAQWIADRLGDPRESIGPPLEEDSDASSPRRRQSQWQGAIISCCQDMPSSAPT